MVASKRFSEAAAVAKVASSVRRRGSDADGISLNLIKPRLLTLMKKEHLAINSGHSQCIYDLCIYVDGVSRR